MARMNGVRFGAIPVAVTIAAYMPDKRRRDVDNICKAVLDALGAGGLYDDDSQVHDLHVFRAGYHKPSGKIIVSCEAADKCPL